MCMLGCIIGAGAIPGMYIYACTCVCVEERDDA